MAQVEYEFLRRLTEGAAAEVYLARPRNSDRRVIFEILRPELRGKTDIVSRFLSEARTRTTLVHPNVARRVAQGRAGDGRPYLVSEPVGESLATLLTASGPMTPQQVLQLAFPLCDALYFLHRHGVVHGNLKPATVYVSRQGSELEVKLIDCGLALLRPGRTLPRPPGRVLVEAEYLSPERIRGQRATAAADVYALGVLLYEALTGFPPFTGTDSALVRRRQLEDPAPALPPECAAFGSVLARCLQKDPRSRFPSVLAVREALETVLRPPPSPLGDEGEDVELADDADVTVAAEVLGPYELMEPLGEGSMGRVFLARHRTLGRTAALKLLKPELARDRDQVRRFFKEAQAVNRINHEHIVEIFDFVEEEEDAHGDRRVYCVMEHLRGQTLGGVLRQGTLPLNRALRLMRQVASALDAAHRVGIVHRDVKPDNIFVIERGGADFAKVLDFGVAKLRNDASATSAHTGDIQSLAGTAAGVVIGTPAFMAPEQMLGKPFDHRVDIYALGGVLYRAVAGRMPFSTSSFAELARQVVLEKPPALPSVTPAGEPVPPELATLVLACLEKDPERRPQSMREVATALESLAPPTVTGVSTVTTGPSVAMPWLARRRRRLAVAGGLAIAGAVSLALFALWPGQPAATPASAFEGAVPSTVTLSIASAPHGATVTRMDTGAVLGATPLDVEFPRKDGLLRVRVALEGHEPVETLVRLDASRIVELSLRQRAQKPPPTVATKPASATRPAAAKARPKAARAENKEVDRDDVLDPFAE